MKVEYSSNNSGGRWWLKDEAWFALERAGWEVQWIKDQGKERFLTPDSDGRWLGALATYATKPDCNSLREAIADWERITMEDSTALGCSCCGPPHYFTLKDDDGNYVTSYAPDYPYSGSAYDGD